jgi:hypothetical protein
MVMNSPQNENGKTNLPLSLCQETEAELTVERECHSGAIDALSATDLGLIQPGLKPGCFIRQRPLIEAKVLC